MTIAITENLSLLRSILQSDTRENGNPRLAGATGNIFAGKLEAALSGVSESSDGAFTPEQGLAEALRLEMLHTTLSLSGEGEDSRTTPFPSGDGRPTLLQTLIKTYAQHNQTNQHTPPDEPATQQNALSHNPKPSLLSGIQSPAPTPVVRNTKAPVAGAEWLDPIIASASQRYGVDVGLIKAVIKAESNYNPTAVSHAGARGLMQLMPGTARSLGVSDSFDPEQNVMAGTRFLKDLLNRYSGDIDKALAAYNWGPGNVDRRPDRMPSETRSYLARVKQLYASYSS